MKTIAFFFLTMIIGGINACIFSRPESVQHVVLDFNLSWQSSPSHQALYVNIDHKEYGGIKIVDETVFALAWNDEFIIAYQYPNYSEVKSRILSKPVVGGFEILNPEDVEYVDHRFVSKNQGIVIYDSSGIDALEGLFPYKKDTLYNIIDIRDYSRRFWGPEGHVHVLESEMDYLQKKRELGIPDLEVKMLSDLGND